MGKGYSKQLARDFWRIDEDLWDPEQEIRWRWIKFVWVYTSSLLAQVVSPIAIVGCVLNLIGIEFGWVYSLVFLLCFGGASALFIATWECLKVSG